MDLSKGEMKDRPCLCVAKNPGPGVFWMVPLSSKIEKYMKIYKSKLEKRGVCDTIVFGYVLGCKKAFLTVKKHFLYKIYSQSPLSL